MAECKISCQCGTLTGVLHDVSPKFGSRAICYCKDCQAFATYLDSAELLEESGGTDIYQTLPSKVTFETGQEHLACLRLSPKGLLRWYASCCDTPLGNTLSSPRVRMVGILTKCVSDPDTLGPVQAMVNTSGASGEPVDEIGRRQVIFAFLKRQIGAMLRRDRKTPFFDTSGALVVTPKVLTKEERQAATP